MYSIGEAQGKYCGRQAATETRAPASTYFCVRVRVQLVIANYILQHNPYQELLPVDLYFVLSENVVAFSIIMAKARMW